MRRDSSVLDTISAFRLKDDVQEVLAKGPRVHAHGPKYGAVGEVNHEDGEHFAAEVSGEGLPSRGGGDAVDGVHSAAGAGNWYIHDASFMRCGRVASRMSCKH